MSLAYYQDRSDKAQRDMLTRLQDEIASLHEERRELVKRLSKVEFRAKNRRDIVRGFVDSANDGRLDGMVLKEHPLFALLERDVTRWEAWDREEGI